MPRKSKAEIIHETQVYTEDVGKVPYVFTITKTGFPVSRILISKRQEETRGKVGRPKKTETTTLIEETPSIDNLGVRVAEIKPKGLRQWVLTQASKGYEHTPQQIHLKYVGSVISSRGPTKKAYLSIQSKIHSAHKMLQKKDGLVFKIKPMPKHTIMYVLDREKSKPKGIILETAPLGEYPQTKV